ncbi:hypothetical protein AXX17_AT3G54530 [Arabidopsis thaliana]|uniref:Thioglucosidase n=1 Tax=Arabidopsis thaliana TaxID=3702 RepID=A0A178V7I5_ARATH|nr:hypothetical protein AXX17_AT3G54530 [Arabidopsis thaliana]
MTSPIGDQTHASNGEVSGVVYNIYIILGFLGSKLFVTVFLSHKFSISIGTEENNAGQTLGVRGGSEWDFLYPQGLRKFLNYAKNKYESPKFMITENGNNFIRRHCDIDYEKKPKLSNLMDLQRTEYHKKHLQSIQQAIQEDGVVVEGYFAWSLLDNCEWNAGYGVRYGLFYVDYNNGLKRFPKMSAMWFKEFLKREEEIEDSEEEEYVLKSTMNKKRFLLATGSSASCFIPKMSESSKALELLF